MLGVLKPKFRLPTIRIRPAVLTLSALALMPVVYIAVSVIGASRNIVYWDEFDTALDLLLQLDAGMEPGTFLERLFAINNEHRMITSRLLFAASWWLTGTIDFRVIGAIGDLFLVALCATLLVNAATIERRVRLAVILAVLMFQLGHFENLLWSGASIDHFQVVALAVGAVVMIARGTRRAFAAACGLSLLATFTLAHGLVMWPVGAALLWRERRWRALAGWAAVTALAALAFFQGFEINSGHRVADFDVAGLTHIAVYWLSLVGAPLALGYARAAPFAGIALLAAALWLAWRGAWRHERVMPGVLLYCLGALALIAVGRSEVAGGQLQSRYMVLSALAWATVAFVALEHRSDPVRPYRLLAICLPALAAFNIVADIRFLPWADRFIEGRDSAALRFKQYGVAGRDQFKLYPVPERATKLLAAAAQRGVYHIPRMCWRVDPDDAQPSSRIRYFVDEMTADTKAIYISGWAAIPEEKSRRGQIHLIFQSKDNFIVYSTVSRARPDVAAANDNPDWRLSGFQLAINRWRLPPEELRVGLMIKDGDEAEFIMTAHRLRPYGRGEALLATGD